MSDLEFDDAAGHFRVLGGSSLATLVAFRHREEADHHDPAEERFEHPSVIFTMSGAWGLTTSAGTVQAGPETVVVARDGMPFRASHDLRKPRDIAFCVDFDQPVGPDDRSDAAWAVAFDRPHAPVTPEIARIRSALLWEAAHRPPAFTLKVDGLVAELVAELARTRSDDPRAGSAHAGDSPVRADLRERLELVRAHIVGHLGEDLDLETLGRVAALSPFYLARMFRRTFGVAPHAYLARARLEAAADLLVRTRLPVARIADRVGWRSPSHLTARFHRHFGVTPSGYRRLAGH